MWQRDTSGNCPDLDDGNTTLTDGSTSYNITGLEEYSNYTITVMAINSIDMATSNNVTGMSQEAGNNFLSACESENRPLLVDLLQLRLLLPLL